MVKEDVFEKLIETLLGFIVDNRNNLPVANFTLANLFVSTFKERNETHEGLCTYLKPLSKFLTSKPERNRTSDFSKEALRFLVSYDEARWIAETLYEQFIGLVRLNVKKPSIEEDIAKLELPTLIENLYLLETTLCYAQVSAELVEE